MNSIAGKLVLITGASSGIGSACAQVFAKNHANLIIIARREKRLETLANELTSKYGIKCYYEKLDIRIQSKVEHFVNNLPKEFSSIDILINNAGLSRGLDPLYKGNIKDWNEMIDTNVKGLLYITRAVLPQMIERQCGHIINIGSIAGRQVYPNGNVYCATKFAVRALTQGLLMDLVNTPIRVSTVDPGMVETEFSLVRFHGDAERAAQTYKGLKPLSPMDIAEVVYFVATRPSHINISEVVVLPTDQASVYHTNRRI